MELIRALRPKQWTKNAIVFAPFIFALGDTTQQVAGSDFVVVLLAAVCFCLVSSGIYLINDVRDIASDRKHSQKKHRPIAAGRVSKRLAITVGIELILAGMILGYLLPGNPHFVLGSYVALQLAYTMLLKQLAMIDLIVIAAGFVLRAITGAVVIEAEVSPWLLVCTFLLAVFLALCKRRQEFVRADAAGGHETRKSLAHYDERLLDQLIVMIASATLVCYAIYTLAPETVSKFNTHSLGFTLPFVLYGLFRYLYLVYCSDRGEQPEQVLLTDIPMIVTICLYGICVLIILL
jgi:4-hydroxybenzoate polyprenyltransferase